MEKIFLSSRNLQALINKLNRAADGGDTWCTIIKTDNENPKFAQSMKSIAVIAAELNVEVGKIYWNVGSLHVYARHYYLVDHFSKTGEIHISKEAYAKLYPNSQFI